MVGDTVKQSMLTERPFGHQRIGVGKERVLLATECRPAEYQIDEV
jgi:hypothetical protein